MLDHPLYSTSVCWLNIWQRATYTVAANRWKLNSLLTLTASLLLKKNYTFAPHEDKRNVLMMSWKWTAGVKMPPLALTLGFSCFSDVLSWWWQWGRWAVRARAGRRLVASYLPPQVWPAAGPRLPAAPWPVWWSWSLERRRSNGRGVTMMHSDVRYKRNVSL